MAAESVPFNGRGGITERDGVRLGLAAPQGLVVDVLVGSLQITLCMHQISSSSTPKRRESSYVEPGIGLLVLIDLHAQVGRVACAPKSDSVA